MANIREQCSWVHTQKDQATQKAKQLVASAIAKARRLEPLDVQQVPVTQAALIIGGGVAGMQAALDIAEAGFKVTIVERAGQLGGHTAQLHRTFPTLELAKDLVDSLIARTTRHARITILLEAEVVGMSGYAGNFQIQIRQGDQVAEVPAGAIVVATGFGVYDARLKPELGYGIYPEVITTLDFEHILDQQSTIKDLKSVVFIQCVGSRDQAAGNPYCSRICCMATAKQAQLLRQLLPEAEVTVFYMDVRAFGKGFEEFYDQARQAGILYRRGNPAEILRSSDRLLVRAEDTLLGEPVELAADLVVLAVGLVPDPEASGLARLLKLPRSPDGFFMEAHPKLRPVETAMAGIFLAGCCQGPKDIGDTISQARAAAATALPSLMQGRVPIEAETSFIEEELCSGCGQCAQVCPYSALSLHPVHGVMQVNAVLCRGCGACAVACPSGAINLHHFTFEQVMAQIEALSRPSAVFTRTDLMVEKEGL